MSLFRRWAPTHTELETAVHGFLLQFELNDSPFIAASEGFVCWPDSQDWNSLSLLQTSFRASATTYDGEQLRNSAYLVSLILASSSSLSWTTVVFGCLGGAFKTDIEMFSSLYSEFVLLRIRVCLLLCMHADKTRSPFLGDGRERPQRPLDGGALFKGGSLPAEVVFCPRAFFLPSPSPSC